MPSAAALLLFDRYHQPVYRFLLRATGRPETAEDLTQEVFLRALATPAALDADAGSRAWLFRVARNLLIDRARRAGRRPTASPLPGPADEPAVAVETGLRLDLRRALATLEPADREVFLLSQTAGLTYREVAECTGLSEAAVRSRIFRARRQLRRALASPDERTPREENG